MREYKLERTAPHANEAVVGATSGGIVYLEISVKRSGKTIGLRLNKGETEALITALQYYSLLAREVDNG